MMVSGDDDLQLVSAIRLRGEVQRVCLKIGWYACGSNTFCDEKWPNLLPLWKFLCDFACDSKTNCNAVVAQVLIVLVTLSGERLW